MKKIILLYLCCIAPLFLMAQVHYTWKVTQGANNELLLSFPVTIDDGWHVSYQSVKIESSHGVEPVGGLVDGVQRLKITAKEYSFKGYMQYVVCTDMQCLAPQYVEFEYGGKQEKSKETSEKTKDVTSNQTSRDVPQVRPNGGEPPLSTDTISINRATRRPADAPEVRPYRVNESLEGVDSSWATILLLSFFAGLLALLTPCVWPIIPLTVSYFLKHGKGIRDAVLFGVSIVTIFLLLGVLVTLAFGSNAMNMLATNAVFNVACFVILVLFGLSFLGLFTIELPASWSTFLDKKSTKNGGSIGVFLMATALVVVSFSCTAPIVGTLLVELATRTSGEGNLITPILGLLSFSVALALPFTICALFPSLLKKMPRSGVWMQHVKVVLGILEIAFALKFLSVADMAYGWGLLSWRTFLVVWAVLFASLTMYLLWRVRPMKWAFLVSLLPLLLTVYLISGVFGGDTKLVSAFMPPKPLGDSSAGTVTMDKVYTDYEEGLKAAKEQNKLIFLDFTGYGCVNCRKMEAAVFTDPRVAEQMQNFIVIHLYVDDRTPLPQQEQVDGRILRTVGDKWSYFEQKRFGQQSQPLYVILSPDGTQISDTYGYDEDVERFLQFVTKYEDFSFSNYSGEDLKQ